MSKEYAFIVIKPHMLQQGFDNMVIEALGKRKLNVVKRKILRLSKEQAAGMYREKKGKNYFPFLVDYMTSGPAMCLIAKSQDGGDATRVAQEYRDWARLNLKLIRYELTTDDVRQLDAGEHPLQEEITREMALRNLMHVPDSFEDATYCLTQILSNTDIDDLRQREPGLCERLLPPGSTDLKCLPVRENL